MVALIGPPPSDFVRRSETTAQCFDQNGKRPPFHHSFQFSSPSNLSPRVDILAGDWIAHDDAAVPPISLEDLEKRLSGSEKECFLDFLRSMLKWLPEERRTAKQLLDNPWLL